MSQHIPQSLFATNITNKRVFILPRLNDTIYLYYPEEKAMLPYYHLDFHGDYLTEKIIPNTIAVGESDDSIILYVDAEQIDFILW